MKFYEMSALNTDKARGMAEVFAETAKGLTQRYYDDYNQFFPKLSDVERSDLLFVTGAYDLWIKLLGMVALDVKTPLDAYKDIVDAMINFATDNVSVSLKRDGIVRQCMTYIVQVMDEICTANK